MQRVLKKRLITAFTLGPLLLWGILALPSEFFAVLMAIFICMGGYEWAKFLNTDSRLYRIIYSAVIAGLLVACWWSLQSRIQLAQWIYFGGILWWFLALTLVVAYPRLTSIWNRVVFKAVAGIFVLVPCWIALIVLHISSDFGPAYALFVIMLMWMADSGAYFGGHRWGNKKLARAVSPGKTIEGVYSALAVTTIYTLIACYLLGFGERSLDQWIIFISLTLCCVLISVLGDLTESMFKRTSHIKDSGSLLPGHGGMLDRIDSLTAAAPVFLLGMLLWKGSSVNSYVRLQGIL